MAEEAGRLEIPVLADLSKFGEDLRRKVKSESKGVQAKVGVEFTTKDLREKLETAVDAAAAGVTATVKVNVKESKRGGLRQRLRQIAKQETRAAAGDPGGAVEVDVTAGRNRLRDKVFRYIAESRAAAKASGGVEVPVTAKVKAPRGRTLLRGALYGSVLALIQPALATLGGLGGGLASLIGPVSQAATGVLATLPSLLTSIAAGAGAGVIAFKGLGESLAILGEAEKRRKAGRKVDYKKIADTLDAKDGLNPALLRAARLLNEVGASWSHMTTQVAPAFWGRVVDEIKPASDSLRKLLVPGLKVTASALGGVAEGFLNWFRSVGFRDDFPKVMSVANRSLVSMGDGLLGVTKGLFGVVAESGPFMDRVNGWIEGFGRWVDESVRANRENGDLEAFLDRAADKAEQLGRVFRDAAKGIVGVFSAGSGVGDSLMKSLEDSMAHFADWAESGRGQRAIRSWFEDMEPVFREAWGALGDIVKAIGRLARDPNTVALLKRIREQFIPALEHLLDALGKKVAPHVVNLLSGLAEVLADLADAGAAETLGGVLDFFSGLVDSFNSFNNAFPQAEKYLGRLLGLLIAYKGLRGLSGVLGLGKGRKVGKKGIFGGLLGGAVGGAVGGSAGSAIGGIAGLLIGGKALGAATRGLGKLAGRIPRVSKHMGRFSTSVKGSTAALKGEIAADAAKVGAMGRVGATTGKTTKGMGLFSRAVRATRTGIGRLLTPLGTAAVLMGSKLGGRLPKVAGGLGKVGTGGRVAAAATRVLGTAAGGAAARAGLLRVGMVGAARALTGPWGLAVTAAVIGTKAWMDHIDRFNRRQADFGVNVRRSTKAIVAQKLRQSETLPVLSQAGLHMSAVTSAVQAGGKQYRSLVGILRDYRDGVGAAVPPTKAQRAATQRLLDALPGLRSQVRGVARDEHFAADATRLWKRNQKDLSDSIKGNLGTLSRQQALITYKDNVDQLRAALKRSGGSLKLNSRRGREARQVLLNAAGAAEQHRQQMLADGASVVKANFVYKQHRKQLLRVLTQMTGNRKEARRLVRQYLGIPDDVRTHVGAPGLKNTRRSVRGYDQEMGDLPKHVTIPHHAPGLKRLRKLVQGLDHDVNNLNDKSIGINVLLKKFGPAKAASLYKQEQAMARRGFADGGILTFADGGLRRERHVAQIAKAGEYRMWAEDETGGEAYIPLARSKRQRSRAIASETVARLGGAVSWFANGGLARTVRANSTTPGWYGQKAGIADWIKSVTDSYYTRAASVMAKVVERLSGGRVVQWVKQFAGRPYGWGKVGPGAFDCSGLQSAVTNKILGKYPFSRRFSTGTFPTSRWARGPGRYMVGSRRGSPGHMSGTLNGVNIESRGGDGVVVGSRARGATNSMFSGLWHLKGFAQGGIRRRRGDGPYDLLNEGGRYYPGGNLAEQVRAALDRRHWLHDGGLVAGRGNQLRMLEGGELVTPGDDVEWLRDRLATFAEDTARTSGGSSLVGRDLVLQGAGASDPARALRDALFELRRINMGGVFADA